MDINGMLGELLKDQAVKAISKKTGLDESSAKSVTSKALPFLLGALKKNALDPEKSKGLDKAIEKHNGEVLENLDNLNLEEGEKILGHIFGNSKKEVEAKVGNKGVLQALAPMVLSALGKANTETGKKSKDLLSDDSLVMNLAKNFLDKDNDGSITDDLFGMAMNFVKGK